MPANTSPIFGLTPRVQNSVLPNNGTTNAILGPPVPGFIVATPFIVDTRMYNVYTAGTNGSFLERATIYYSKTTPDTVANFGNVIHLMYSTISTGTATTSDTFPIASVAANKSGQLLSANATTANLRIDIPLNIGIPASTFIYAIQQSIDTSTSGPISVTVYGYDY